MSRRRAGPRLRHHGRWKSTPVLLLLAGLASSVMAQPPATDSLSREPAPTIGVRPLVFGLSLEPELTRHTAAFPVGGCPGSFTPGSEYSFGLGLFGVVSLLSPLELFAVVRYRDISTRLLSTSFGDEARNTFTGGYDTVSIHTRYDATIRGISVSTGVAWRPFDGLSVGLGPSLLLVTNAQGHHSDSILSPMEYRFASTGEITRPRTSASPITLARNIWGLDLVLRSKVVLGSRIAAYPALRASYGLSNVATGGGWSMWSIGASIGLGYDVAPRDTPVRPVPVIVTVQEPPRRPYLRAAVVARGVDDEGNEYPNPIIEIEETPWVQIVPLIPHIFFDSASATPPGRYVRLWNRQQADRFSLDSLLRVGPLDMHWQLLNVVGSRLREHPQATGVITGTGSGDEMHAAWGRQVALARAAAMRRYLYEVWGVDTARLRLDVRAVPTAPSSEESADGRAENRRVEFEFSDPAILAAVVVSRMATIASPPAVKFYQTITADTTIAEWRLSVVQGEKELLRFAGSGEETSLRQDKLWSLADLRVNRDLTEIRYRLDVQDVTGQTAVADGRFRVVERRRRNPTDTIRAGTELTEHYLVGFNFNSPELRAEHRARLATIAEAIDSTSEVLIIGYTDKLGDIERNKALSLERATVVYETLRELQMRQTGGGAASYVVRGYGPREELFDNELPEGRTFSRMVRIVVTSTRGD